MNNWPQLTSKVEVEIFIFDAIKTANAYEFNNIITRCKVISWRASASGWTEISDTIIGNPFDLLNKNVFLTHTQSTVQIKIITIFIPQGEYKVEIF